MTILDSKIRAASRRFIVSGNVVPKSAKFLNKTSLVTQRYNLFQTNVPKKSDSSSEMMW